MRRAGGCNWLLCSWLKLAALLLLGWEAGPLAWHHLGAPRRVDLAIELPLVCLSRWQLAGNRFEREGGKKILSTRLVY